MKTYQVKQPIIMLALSLIAFLHSPLLLAETSDESGNGDEQYTVNWPLPAGETIRDLASLFYPKNQRMQQYFIAETIKLNREAQPELHPSTIFSQDNVIVIPNIKELAKKNARRVSRRN